MAGLPVISGKKAVKAFQKAGWKFKRVGSSRHIIMKKEDTPITLSIPDHKILDRGLLRALIRDALLSVDEFCKLLED
ncbi:MAG: type II toxin-antitoxin system HicA family toxin [Deltaproteobacteria bacterium]|nr:type II toxin-antitoxin system HicA family toxin [Deltaproteobacteria bacterium]